MYLDTLYVEPNRKFMKFIICKKLLRQLTIILMLNWVISDVFNLGFSDLIIIHNQCNKALWLDIYAFLTTHTIY